MQLIILQPVAIRSIVLSINMPCLASSLFRLPFQPSTCIYYVLHKFLMLNMLLFFFAVCLRLQVNPQNKNQFYGISPERGFADFIFAHIILHIVVMNFIGWQPLRIRVRYGFSAHFLQLMLFSVLDVGTVLHWVALLPLPSCALMMTYQQSRKSLLSLSMLDCFSWNPFLRV